MCLVSNVSRDWIDRGPWNWPPQIPQPKTWPEPNIDDIVKQIQEQKQVSRKEFDALKKEVEQLRKDLEAARKQDIEENAEDCEMDDKVELLRKIAEAVGVDLGEVFGGHK